MKSSSETSKTSRLLLAAASLSILGSAAVAQTVYRCVDESGATTFQDRPCDDERTETRMHIEPNVVDSSRARANVNRQRAIDARLAAERERKVQARQRNQNEQRPSATNSIASALERNEQSNSEPLRDNGPCPPAQIPLNSSRLNPARGWSDSKGYEDLKCGAPQDTFAAGPRPDHAPRFREPPQPPEPPQGPEVSRLKNCIGGTCRDNNGNRFNRIEPYRVRKTDGTICKRNGDKIICD